MSVAFAERVFACYLPASTTADPCAALPLVPLSRYECAVTLVQLSSAPTAVRAAANCFCQLLVSHSDNNVKLIVLDRLQVRGGCVVVHSSLVWWAAPARM